MKNQAAFMTDIRRIEIKNISMPEPKDDEVLVKIEYVGICGSDLHYYNTDRIGKYIVKTPFLLGHEAAGVIVEVGASVVDLKPGDRVALEPSIPCGNCSMCREGKYNLCPDVAMMAVPPNNGAFVKYLTHPEAFSYKLPVNVSTMEGALVEPLAVGLHAASQGGINLGDDVTILGAGCIGLVSLMVFKASGAGKVYVVDIEEKRLSFARKLGASATINAKKSDTIKVILNLTDGLGTKKVIECVGKASTIAQTPYLVSRSGTIVLIGLMLDNEAAYNFVPLIRKEASIQTVFRYRNKYPIAIEAIASGMISINDIVTHIFEFKETGKALNFVLEKPSDVVKAIIKMS